jgi:hypothetical protein
MKEETTEINENASKLAEGRRSRRWRNRRCAQKAKRKQKATAQKEKDKTHKKRKKTLNLDLAKKFAELHVGESPGFRTFRIFGSADRPRAATSIPQGPETRTFPCT